MAIAAISQDFQSACKCGVWELLTSACGILHASQLLGVHIVGSGETATGCEVEELV